MSDHMQIRPSVLLPLRDHTAFLSHYFNQGGIGGVFVPGHLRLASAEEIDLEVAFAKEQVTVHTRGVVRWKRLSGKKTLPAGIGVEFLESERRTRDLLVDFAEGRSVRLVRRRSRRYPVMLEIDYATDSVFLNDITEDISRDGAFILTGHSIEVGTVLALKLRPPGSGAPIDVKGEVRWLQTDGRRGFGVRFIFDRPHAEEAILRLIDGIKQQVATDLDFSKVAH